MPLFPALFILLWLARTYCREDLTCFDAAEEGDIIPTVPDCRFILAHLPFNNFNNLPRFPNARLDSNSPFLPIFRIRHRTCQILFQAQMYPPRRQRIFSADWRGLWMPHFWPEMKQAAEDVITVCGQDGQSGKIISSYGLEEDAILKITVSNSDHRLIRQSCDERIARQWQSLREVDDSFNPVSIWAEASYEV